MKILIQRNERQKLASKISAASFIKHGISANDISFLEFENNSLLKSQIGKKYLRNGKTKVFRNDLQSFTLLRFYGPEFVNYKENILVIDPDVFAIKYPKNILNFLDSESSLACTFINNQPRSEVMLINASKVKWHFEEIIKKLFNFEIDYNDLISLKFDKNLKINKLDINYNSHDKIDNNTIFLHTTNRITQPWKEGLKKDFEKHVSFKEVFKAYIKKIFKLKYNKSILDGKYIKHPDDNIIKKIKSYFDYAKNFQIISDEEIDYAVEKGYFSKKFIDRNFN